MKLFLLNFVTFDVQFTVSIAIGASAGNGICSHYTWQSCLNDWQVTTSIKFESPKQALNSTSINSNRHYIMLWSICCTKSSDSVPWDQLSQNQLFTRSIPILMINPNFDIDSCSLQYIATFSYYMWPDLRKPSVCDPRAIRAMRVFSSSGPNLSKCRFCHIHVKQPFF